MKLPPQYAHLNSLAYVDLRVKFDEYRNRFGVLLDRDDRLTEYLEDNNASINNPRLLVSRPHRE